MARPYLFVVSENETDRHGQPNSALYALDARTGKTQWTHPQDLWQKGRDSLSASKGSVFGWKQGLEATTGAELSGVGMGIGSALSQGIVFHLDFAFGDGLLRVRAVNASTGDSIWDALIPRSASGYASGDYHLAVSEGTIYAGGSIICALDAASGKQAWMFHTPKHRQWRYLPSFIGWQCFPLGTPAVADGVVVAGTGNGNVHCLDARNGLQLWEFETGMRVLPQNLMFHHGTFPFARWPVLSEGRVYMGGIDGILYALDIQTGRLLWQFKFLRGTIVASPAVGQGLVFVGSVTLGRPDKLHALDARTGESQWEIDLKGGLFASPVVWDDWVYVCDSHGNIRAIDSSTGLERWRTELRGGVLSSPILYQEGVVEWPMAGGNPQRTGTGMAPDAVRR